MLNLEIGELENKNPHIRALNGCFFQNLNQIISRFWPHEVAQRRKAYL